MMASTLQKEQQTEEIAEGMFEWKIKLFRTSYAEGVVVDSPVFKIGRNTGTLNLKYTFSRHIGGFDELKLSQLNIELHIAQLLGIDIFSKATYYKGGIISRNRDVYLSTEGQIYLDTYCFPLISCNNEKYVSAVFDHMPDMVSEDILTFCLVWSDKKIQLDSIIRSPDQIEEIIPRKSLEKLSKDLKAFLERKTNTDCVLMIGEEQFQVHRAVLSARSEVFAAMFQHDTLENRSGVVNISDVDAKIMSDVLHYVYTGQIRRLNPETAAAMYIAADKYALVEMRDDCLDYLMRNITMENFVDAIVLADKHELSALEKKVIQFTTKNVEEFQEKNTWREFSRTHPSLGSKYLQSTSTFQRIRSKRKKKLRFH